MKTLYNIYSRALKSLILGGTLSLMLLSCKDGWLEAKRDISLIVPSSLTDMHDMLRNTRVFMYDEMGMGILSADDHYIDDATFQTYIPLVRNCYTWQTQLYQGELSIAEWDKSYQQIVYSNLILEGLDKIEPDLSTRKEWNTVKGGAIFYRGRAFYNLAQLFSQPWSVDQQDLGALGIPLRLSSDLQEPVTRSTLQETYQQIESDLKQAATLLDISGDQLTDASKRIAWAMLARLNLTMGRYNEALLYADSCLFVPYKLMDLNQLDSTILYPFSRFNDEVWFHALTDPNYVAYFSVSADTNLVSLYEHDDLRKPFYFGTNKPGSLGFRGNYTGTADSFSGIAADELLLIRAECLARLNQLSEALQTLDDLLVKRYKAGKYHPASAKSMQKVLDLILLERRKELLMRGLRWADLRRLNQETTTQITLQRTIIGRNYTLHPNDLKYTLPIPDYVVQQSKIKQNVR